ncbi:MAG TPA: hypothetical protein VN442_12935 [Bryobacteraceae bacterium]|nr:hypothetical protein [Bryobacteraceae bacterium]HWR37462.1 hypothetical protein [Clostridia bacterium]
MGKRLYAVTHDLHLYAGLFLSPFILVFAISVVYLAHFRISPEAAGPPRIVTGLPVVRNLEQLTGRDQVIAVRGLLDHVGVAGEIDFIRRISKEHRLVIPVLLPGLNTTVDLNVEKRTASISQRRTGIVNALIHLHKMPGPHNASIRGNSTYVRLWRWLADATSYGLLFLTLSGVYLWAVLRAERRIGGILLSLGAVSFFGLVYAITH